jgi:hypothetical protein
MYHVSRRLPNVSVNTQIRPNRVTGFVFLCEEGVLCEGGGGTPLRTKELRKWDEDT